ncbi:MAG: cation-efflux pump, partial [Bacilli bacterium]|nr:cation-efflux pump [Bacilli bacterium]
PALSICIGLFIIYSGFKLIKETASPLIGLTPDSEFVQNFTKDVLSYKEVLGIHDLICHSYGPNKIFITLHVEVDGYSNIMDIHDVVDNIEMDLGNKYGAEITIHMDPIDTRNPEIPLLKEKISSTLKKIDGRITFHDLRLVAGPTHTNVLFDVAIPCGLKIEKSVILNALQTNIKSIDAKYNLVVKIESNYSI